jgi:hypothetical protein
MTQDQRLIRLAAAVLLIGPGLLAALAAWPPLSAPIALFLDLLYWPLDGAQDGRAEATRIALAILGGVTAGWGVMLWSLAGEALARHPDLIRPVFRRALLTWFVLDSTGSVLAGAPLNAAVNAGVLAAFLVPLSRGARRPAAS